MWCGGQCAKMGVEQERVAPVRGAWCLVRSRNTGGGPVMDADALSWGNRKEDACALSSGRELVGLPFGEIQWLWWGIPANRDRERPTGPMRNRGS